MTQEELIHALGRKWRINALQLLTLCRHYNHYIDKDIPISTRSNKLCEKLECSIMQLSRIIDKGIEIGLFRIINDKYGFNHIHTEDNKCRVYSINNEILEQLEEITNTLHMERMSKEREKNLYIKEVKVVTNNDKDDKEIIPYELPEISCRKRYERGMLPWIYERYPQIYEIQNMLAEMNLKLSEEDHWFYTYMVPNAREKEPDKYTFSCRATSEICHLNKESINPNELIRDDLLNDYFGKDKWEEYDLNASIYRIARSCKDGKWYDDNNDIYKLFYGRKFTTKEERKAFKDLCMIVAFRKDLYSAYLSYKRSFNKYTMKYDEVLPIIAPLANNINDFCGEVDTDIFLHESYIMTSIAYDLFKRGIKVVQLYDCLFVPKGTARYLDSILSKSFLYYYNTYII